MSKPPFPDLEIYIKSSDLEAISHAIGQVLPIGQWQDAGTARVTEIVTEVGRAELVIQPKAYRTYTSVWLKSNLSNFACDAAFAAAVSKHLPDLIRCSQGSWSAESEDDDLPWFWFEKGDRGESRWD